jgi:ubiquinone/menaquinone biosynthesis C-methylase UbiE
MQLKIVKLNKRMISRRVGRIDFFDQSASNWDKMTPAESMATLRKIVKMMNISPASHILDVGTGTGVTIPFLLECVGMNGRITGLDFAPRMIALARSKGFPANVDFVVANVTTIPYPAEYFDHIVCNACLPHVPDKVSALREMSRVLKVGGVLSISLTWNRAAINRIHERVGGAITNDRMPDPEELVKLLTMVGLVQTCLYDEITFFLAQAKKESAI